MLHLLPYALAAYSGLQSYRGARQAGVGGLGSLVRGAIGAYGGYSMGSAGMSMFPGSAAAQEFAKMPLTQSLSRLPGVSQIPTQSGFGEDIARGSYSDQLLAAQKKTKGWKPFRYT